jgi:WD40 repeat protein
MAAMAQHYRCANGHEWEASGTLVDCPQCGAAAEDDEYPDELPPPPPRPLPSSTLSPKAAAAPGALPALPGYEVLRELGRGGMGVVYLARDRRLGRHVALKMILAGSQSCDAERARFRLEAETVARLQHANIVQIFEVSEWNGQPYLALEYVSGGPLSKQLGKPLPPESAAALAETLARAVQYAHDQGVIHRDLKPGNVLVAGGEWRVAGEVNLPATRHGPPATPKITDFGLAKRLDGDSGTTESGSVLGTPNYMAPEQAAGRVREVGPAADVYALGAILYELLTGRPPFLGASPMETVLHVIQDEPAPPRLLNSEVPRDLDTIALKCLQKEPRKRYASAGALADDLRRFGEGRPILARPVSRAERIWRWAKRNPTAATLGCAFFGALLAGTIVSTFFAFQSFRKAASYLDMQQTAERHLYLARMNMAARAWEEGQIVRVLELLEQTRPAATGGIDLRGFEWFHLWYRCHEHDLHVVRAHEGLIHQLDWSSRGVVASVGADGHVKLWDGGNGELLAELREGGLPMVSVAFSPDGRTLAAGDEVGVVRVWDVVRRLEIRSLNCGGEVMRCVAFSPDGAWLLASSAGGSFWRWETSDWRGGRFDSPNAGSTNGIAFVPDGSRFISVGNDGRVMFRDANSSSAASVKAVDGYLSAVAVSSDGRLVASGSVNGPIKLWDADTRKLVKEYVGLAGDAAAVEFIGEGRFLLSAGISGALTIRNIQGQQVRAIAHTGPIESIAVAPDQKSVAMAGPDGQIKWARLEPPTEGMTEHADRVYAVAISSDGRVAASASRDGMIKVWNVATGDLRGEWSAGAYPIRAVAFASTDDQLVTAGGEGFVHIWDIQTRREVSSWKAAKHAVFGAAWFPDRRRLATAGYTDPAITVWDVETRRQIARWELGHDRAWCVAVSPDGKRVAAGGSKGEVRAWEVDTGKELLVATRGDGWIWSVAFSPDSSTIVAGTENGAIARWDAATGAALPSLPGHPVMVRALGFLPDGRTLFSGSDDGTIRLWDLLGGEERARLTAHAGQTVWNIAVTPDGRTLISAGSDNRLRFWRSALRKEADARR